MALVRLLQVSKMKDRLLGLDVGKRIAQLLRPEALLANRVIGEGVLQRRRQ
jgi:hypothetical protein